MIDLRTRPDFIPEFYPLLEGLPAALKAGKPDPTLDRKLAVLAAYYDINVCYQKLRVLRKKGKSSAGSAGGEAELLARQELERALLARDRLDDEFAAFGLVSSPEVSSGIIINVRFTRRGEKGVQYSTISMCFAVSPA